MCKEIAFFIVHRVLAIFDVYQSLEAPGWRGNFSDSDSDIEVPLVVNATFPYDILWD